MWYLPSFYGDIRLTSTGETSCTITVEKVTPSEQKALEALEAKGYEKGWFTTFSTPSREARGYVKGDLAAPPPPFVGLEDGACIVTVLQPIDKIAGILSKELKPGRPLVSVVKFSDGKMEEIVTSTALVAPSAVEPGSAPAPTAATTVAKPTKGCPRPHFPPAEIKAREVLEAFLDRDQRIDFRRHNQFVSIGQDTGHPYLLTSRYNRAMMDRYGRSLYDVAEERAVCTHDYSVPAAEELLALHVMLQVPGGESWLRHFEA